MPRKVFVAGEILTAADVNANLMDQAVMVFGGTATRGSAIPSPSEGMVTYLEDVNQVQVYDGSGWGAVGKILQVVSATKTDSFTTTSTSFVDVTGVTVSITPTATTSKVLVFVSGTAGNTSALRLGRINLLRDATNVAQSTGGTSNQTLTVFTGNADNGDSFAISFLDSPNTTSATTYKIQANTNNADGTFVVGRYAFSGNQPSVTTITAMEVAG